MLARGMKSVTVTDRLEVPEDDIETKKPVE
jgi:hypothetical protein